MPVVPAVHGLPSAEEFSALPAAELAARLAEAYQLIAELSGQIERLTVLNGLLEELERRARRDSSTSSRPPSSDSPYKKRPANRSLRERGKRRPGKQPGDPGMTRCLVDDPDESFDCPRAACRGCGANLAAEPVTAQRRHQVTDIEPAPKPKVRQYVAQSKQRPCCGRSLRARCRRMCGRGPASGRRPAPRRRT